MYKLEFTLKQHTPIIHFQHSQAGATLRATEVKPKLDFFIMKKLLNNPEIPDTKVREVFLEKANNPHDDNQKKWKNWLVGNGDHASLDYKMSIVGLQSKKYVIASRLSDKQQKAINHSFKFIPESAFFAEEKSIGNLFDEDGTGPQKRVDLKQEYLDLLKDITKQGIVNYDTEKQGNDVHVKIVSFNSSLLDKITNNILISFFLSENFGCRQNKGFGCYTVNEIEKVKQPCNNISSYLKESFDYVYCKNSSDGFGQALSEIQKDYKLLKAGRGRQEGYAKSKLFLYFAKKKVRWEKRWIKQEFNKTSKTDFKYDLAVNPTKTPTEPIDTNLKNDWDDNNHPHNATQKYQYIRALLGIAEQFEFQTTSPNKDKFVVQIGSENNPIQRFRSPITFKFIDGNIYLLANKVEKSDTTPLDGIVEFTFRLKDRKNKLLDKPKIQIPSPPSIPDTFDIEAFLDFAIKDTSDNATIGNYIKL